MQERRYYYLNYRQSFGRSGSSVAIGRDSAQHLFISVIMPDGQHLRLGFAADYEEALRIQDYCIKHDTLVKLALIELYEKGNYDPMEAFLEQAKQFGDLPRRKLTLNVEVTVEMSGSDNEIINYMLMHIRGAISVKSAKVSLMEGPRLTEPRPKVI
jgi:hypothetical protein